LTPEQRNSKVVVNKVYKEVAALESQQRKIQHDLKATVLEKKRELDKLEPKLVAASRKTSLAVAKMLEADSAAYSKQLKVLEGKPHTAANLDLVLKIKDRVEGNISSASVLRDMAKPNKIGEGEELSEIKVDEGARRTLSDVGLSFRESEIEKLPSLRLPSATSRTATKLKSDK